MTQFQKISLFLLRISIGWLFFWAGITKVLDPEWSSAGYLQGAKTFADFYQWLASPSLLPVTNFVNEWGLTLLGLALILGVFLRLSSILGALLMLLYYLPILQFPYPNAHSFLVDEHIVYIFSLLVLGSLRSGRIWGLEQWCSNLPVCSKFPKLRELLG
ncbi:MAG: DoxX family membrane protein [Candidatus Wildermuthbacteria bacterium]|nr:DoxX family membrane protein [Candidatus Wildermuthbacteria bacterium]